MFLGPDGLRPGWRVFLFVALVLVAIAVPLAAASVAARALHVHVVPWLGAVASETVALGAALGATAVMARLERRSAWSYGLRDARWKRRVAAGAAWGVAFMSLEIVLLLATGRASVARSSSAPAVAIGFALVWAYAFVCTGLFEEIAFRGYALATLARTRLGFWPAAIVLAAIFGALHGVNGGEAAAGEVAAGLFGLALTIAIRVTGSLWWAIGLHAGWDWAESYVWGVPDSGQVVQGTFLNVHAGGPAWLSGGTAGPEASVLVLVPLILIPLAAWRERSAVAA